MSHEVFICYSSHDKPVAEAVCATLESRHIRCWIAPRDVLPGMEWAEAIVDAIDGSRVLVLVLSSDSNSSPQVIREVGRAASKGIPIVPLRIDDVLLSKAMEFFISSHHFLDAQTPPLKKHLKRLVDTVQQLLTQKREPRKGIEIPEEKPAVSVERPAEAVRVVTKATTWFWSGIVLLSVGLGLLTTVTVPILLGKEMATWDLLMGMLILVLAVTIPGVYCLRRGMAQQLQTKPAEGAVPNWWWLLPVVLAFVGGIISWAKQKDVNWRKAMNMLTLGIISTLIWTIPFFALQAPVTPSPTPPPAPPPAAPAQFDVISLNIEPPEVVVGETVSITAEVKNTGGSEGSYTVILTMDGVTVDTKEVTLTAGMSKTISFSLVKDTPGVYDITLNGLRGTFSAIPLPVQPPPPGATLIFEDDFNNPTSGWTRESLENHEIGYEDGEYHILVKEFDWSAWGCNPRAGQLTDFTLEIDARLVSGPTQSAYGVLFRVQDGWTNFYRFLVTGDGYYYVGTNTNHVWTILQGKTKSAFIKEGNSTNHLKVVCKGSQIELYVNGHHLTTITDDSFADGYVGMIVYTPELNTHVAFDNIRVYSLD